MTHPILAKLALDTPIEVPLSQSIIAQTRKRVGFVPNMYVKMAHNPSLLEAYTQAYTTFRKLAGFNPIEQEVVLLSVAVANTCGYCTAAHSFVAATMSNVPADVIAALQSGTALPDPKLDALSNLTRALTNNRGLVLQDDLDAFLAVGYTEAHVLGIITGIAVKTMSNYANHLTQPAIDQVFASYAHRAE